MTGGSKTSIRKPPHSERCAEIPAENAEMANHPAQIDRQSRLIECNGHIQYTTGSVYERQPDKHELFNT